MPDPKQEETHSSLPNQMEIIVVAVRGPEDEVLLIVCQEFYSPADHPHPHPHPHRHSALTEVLMHPAAYRCGEKQWY